jgi:hypothetical protein
LQHLAGPSQTAAEFVHQRGRKVAEIMTLHPVTIAEDTQIEDIVRIIEQHSVKHLPVMRGDQLVGIVTRTDLLQAITALAPHVPDPTPDDQHIRSAILAAMDGTNWSPSSLNLIVRDGVVYLSGMVANEHCRQAAVVAAENVPGVRQVRDQLCSYPPPEEELGGGDIVSLQQQPSTIDDMPL